MDESPPVTESSLEQDAETYCYAHPKTPTKLRCSRCDRPICGRCAIPASVGQHCPECVAEARRTAPKVRSAMAATAPAVMAILGINIAVFVLQNLEPEITNRFGMRPLDIADGELWRLLTPMVLHAGGIHLVFNLLALYIYGPYVEQAFHAVRFVGLYVISGFFASCVSYAFGPVNKIGVGASGAIFGLIGILVVYAYRRRTSTLIREFLRTLLVIIGINLFIGFTNPFIDNYAHIGGLVGGLILGAGFDRPEGDSASVGIQIMTAGGLIALGILLVTYRTAQLL